MTLPARSGWRSRVFVVVEASGFSRTSESCCSVRLPAQGAGEGKPDATPAPAVWISLLTILALAACGRAAPKAPNSGIRTAALRGSNVLVVTVDTLRADRVGAYGGGTLTPAIDRLSSSGVRFTHAYAHAPLTLPAHTSIFTGLAPATHGVHNNGDVGIGAETPTLADRLRSAGYRTAAFVGAFVLDARFGLSRGFDEYDDHVGSDTGAINFAFAERSADRVTKAAGDWILDRQPSAPSPQPSIASPQPSAVPAGPWFAWVHLFDPHAPYRAPQVRSANPYDSEVAFADAQLGALLDRLRASGQLDHTLIVVLADHAESLGEHGEATHGLFAYNATLRIPMIVAGPSIRAQVVDAPVAQFDVLPTILDLLGLDAPSHLDGRSLRQVIRGEPASPRAIYFEALDAYLTRNWAPLTGVINDGWKYIDLPEPEMYDLAADPNERYNLFSRETRRVADLQRALHQWPEPGQAPVRPPAPLDPDAAARLRALGYAGVQPSGTARRTFNVADDPKRLLDLDRRYEQALTLTGDRRYDEAIGLLQSVIADRPDFTLAYTNLASVLIQIARPREAIALLAAATRRGLSAIELSTRLGAAYLAAGDPAGVVRVLGPLSDRGGAPLEALNTLGVALSQQGRYDRARQLFAQVLRQSPGSATTWNNLGLLELSARRPREAASAFERAVAVDPAFGPGWQGLGAARASSDPEGAIDAWRRASALLPNEYDLLFNLAVLLHERGRDEEARPYIERFIATAPPGRYRADVATLQSWLRRERR